VVEDPRNAPGFSQIPAAGNFEGTVIPRNGVEVQLSQCPGIPTKAQVMSVLEFRNTTEYAHIQSLNSVCFTPMRDHLNHFEVRLSQSHIEVWATDYSADGVTFAAPTLVASTDLALTFTRGYVSATTHNHATMKYSMDTVDAWVARWDNIGFDGPIINGAVEFSGADSLVSGTGTVGVGYLVYDAAVTPAAQVLVPNVDLTGATAARLSFNMEYQQNQFGDATFSTYAVRYRLNGQAWHVYTLTPEDLALLETGVVLGADLAGQANSLISGTLSHVIDVPLAELVPGTNTLDVTTQGVLDHGYHSTLANVDLVLAH
jgi:hypothetical protein